MSHLPFQPWNNSCKPASPVAHAPSWPPRSAPEPPDGHLQMGMVHAVLGVSPSIHWVVVLGDAALRASEQLLGRGLLGSLPGGMSLQIHLCRMYQRAMGCVA